LLAGIGCCVAVAVVAAVPVAMEKLRNSCEKNYEQLRKTKN